MINNPASLYGGGAFKVDSTAAVNYYLKRQAQDQAKEATLDKYFTHLMDKASPTGMRVDKEGEAFQQSLNNAKNYYIQNKKAILGGDVTAQQKYIELTNQPFQIVAASKEALNTAKTALQIRKTIQGQGEDRWTDQTTGIDAESGLPKLDDNGNYMGLVAHDQKMYDINPDGSVTQNPKFKLFDINSIQTNPKLLNVKELQDYTDNSLTSFQPEDISSGIMKDPNRKGYEIPIIEKGFKKETLAKIGETVKTISEDPSMKATINKLYPYKTWPLQHQVEFDALNKLHNDLYGTDIKNGIDLYATMQVQPRMVTRKDLGTSKLSDDATRARDLEDKKRYFNYTKNTDPTVMANADQVELGFERITPGTYGNVKIEGGVVKNLDGTPYTSPGGQPSVDIPLGALSTEIIDEFPTGTKVKSIAGIKAIVENGKIKFAAIKGRVSGKDYGTINRTVLYNKEFSKNAVPVPIKTVTSTPKTPAAKTGGVVIPGMNKTP